MNAWKMVGLPLSAVSAIGIVVGFMSTSAVTACSSSKSSSSGGSGGGSGSGEACPTITPGTFPPADCYGNSDQSTCGTPTTCKIDQTQCGSTSTCEPLADNSSKTTWDLRMRRIEIVAPKTLANPVIQNAVVTHGVDLNLAQCGEKGDGSFSWLLSFNSTTGMLKTGGAPPSSDPLGAGYCFVNRPNDAVPLGPIQTKLTKQSDGTYSSDIIPSINIPIYYIPQPGATPQIIVLPINGGQMQKLQFSANNNCIGSIDTTALDGTCGESSDTCAKWHPSAAIAGYITLEQADKVHVPLVQGHTLCVILTGDSSPNADGTCERDGSGKIKFTGDYCSTTNSAGGCGDAYWMAATFAASAVKITDGAGVADCNGGGSTQDAGSSDATPE